MQLFVKRARVRAAKRAKSSSLGLSSAVIAACVCLVLSGCQPVLDVDSEPSDGIGATLLSPKDAPFNAKGDGVTDDTAALQAWLTAGGVRLAGGTYRIVQGLTLSGDRRVFFTENAKILADGTNITALTATGNNANIRVSIDGNHKAAYGLKVTGAGTVVEDGQYENFRSATKSARGIDASTSGGIIVRNNVVRNVVSVGDKTGGNGNGLARGIGLNSKVAATAKSFISGNWIENIGGEEGDAISLLFSDGKSYPFASGNVTVSKNTIRNVSRRFIKVQASNVAVAHNKLDFDLPTPPANPSSAIHVIRSADVKVIGNEINPNLLGGGIAVNGASTAPLAGIEILDNVLRQSDMKSSISIYLKWTTSPAIRDNSIYGGGGSAEGGVLISLSKNARVQGNAYSRGVPASG